MASTIDTTSLKDQSVLITGGASGLGLATVRKFADAGAYVTIVDIRPDQTAGEELAREISAAGNVCFVQCDTTNHQSQVLAFQTALRFSPTRSLDVVAMFAGVDDSPNLLDLVTSSGQEPTLDGTPPDLDSLSLKCIDVNLKGVYYTTYLALHYFRLEPTHSEAEATSRTKSLTFVSSLAGYMDDTHDSIYTASKFGLRGLFRSIRDRAAAELGIRCNLIAPWAIKTPMTAPIVKMLEQFGIQEGKGVSFAPLDGPAEAAVMFAVDESLVGRAIATMPEGNIDLGDDSKGQWAEPILNELIKARKAAGDLVASVGD